MVRVFSNGPGDQVSMTSRVIPKTQKMVLDDTLLNTQHYICGGARGVMVIVVGNGHGDMSSILDEADCISHSTKTLEKVMNPIILPPAMSK